jgi:cytochrome c biogenesis protein CcdA
MSFLNPGCGGVGRLAFLTLLAVSAVIGGMSVADAQNEAPAGIVPVPVEFFHETGCSECERVRRDVLPELERRYSGYVLLQQRDIGAETNYLALVAYGRKQGLAVNEPVCMVVDRREMLPGFERIRDELFAAVDRAIARHYAEDGTAALVDALPPVEAGLLTRHVRGFTLAGVLSAALVDSFNPCAMATLVFFMSLLLSSQVGVRRMLLAGGGFVVACFFTYLAIGFGLLRILYLVAGFRYIKTAIDGVLIATLLVLAALSFRDAARFRRTGRSSEVMLRLPQGVQQRIHEVMKRGLRNRSLVLGGLGIGVVVTVLESVCTGQVYVPALVLMIKSGQSVWRSAAYLGMYNLIFVMPLIILLTLACFGLRTPALVEWSRRNVATGKVLLGLFFLGMAAMMLALNR